MSKKWLGRWGLVIFVIVFVFLYRHFQLGQYLSLEVLKEHQQTLSQYNQENPWFVMTVYMLFYILTTALSLPGATILTLAGGAIFGLFKGVVLVSFASTIGATLAFLASRFLLRDYVQNRFKDKLKSINKGVEREGAFYLFTLRLVPLFPFFLINLVMGLTPIKSLTYFYVSQVGMLPGTFVYVNAGTELAKITSLKGILSPSLLISFSLIGLMPWFSKWIVNQVKSRKHLGRFKKPKKFDYNMIVIGAGSAGLVSAYIAAAVKAKVALIEKNKMGGDCLNTGCVPSKALIRSAKVYNYFRRAQEFGFEALPAKVNFGKVMKRVHSVIKAIEPHDSVERYTHLGVECIQGAARIVTPYEVEVNGDKLTTKNIVIATGASPQVPSIEGLEDIPYLTSENLWDLKELPEKLVVLGGGPIGCEMAQAFARLGSQVTIIEMRSALMARVEDEEVSQAITKKFKEEGISVCTQHHPFRIDKEKKEIICNYNEGKVSIAFDALLLAMGRCPNVNGFGLEELGVEVNNQGFVVADEFLRTTNYPNIYVCGDVTGPYQFTHTASHQAWYVAVNALFSPFKKFKVDYRVIPWCTFTDPEVARVGLSECEAKERGVAYQVSHFGIDDLDRAIAEGEAEGFVKVLTAPGSDKILGVTIVGQHAGDIIAEFVIAMKYGIGMNKILGTIHIYPTLAEANKYVAGVWKKANAPQKVLEYLAKFHAWRR